VVTKKLLPIAVRATVDNLRTQGPRYAVRNARKLRLALEALGPAFVKLGQCLSAREDVLSEEVAAEIRRLCDQVPPFPWEEAAELVCGELGPRAPELPSEAVAAASLGQVYKIVVDGKTCAMKVQRPDLVGALALDLVLLRRMAAFSRRVIARLCTTSVDPEHVVCCWSQTMWRELDYLREAHMTEHMSEGISSSCVAGLIIPKVCWHLTSPRVLTTEWVNGLKVTDNPRKVTTSHIRVGVETYAAMILDLGLIHADPHAGNLLLISDTEMCLLDFGMVVEVPPSHRYAWAQCLVHLVRGDHEGTLDELVKIGFFPRECPRQTILPVLSRIWSGLVSCGSDTKMRKQLVRTCYEEIKTLVRDFDFDLPDYYLALVRALLTLEGIALSADCDFDIFKAAFPVAIRALTVGRPSRSGNGNVKGALAAAVAGRALDEIWTHRRALMMSGMTAVAVIIGLAALPRVQAGSL
jgi:predicted unusual protein kinase regulating ubiquinone biosynthesis (AarF/ABC1/UbiB family)